jgi:hypothetical protein
MHAFRVLCSVSLCTAIVYIVYYSVLCVTVYRGPCIPCIVCIGNIVNIVCIACIVYILYVLYILYIVYKFILNFVNIVYAACRVQYVVYTAVQHSKTSSLSVCLVLSVPCVEYYCVSGITVFLVSPCI